MQRRRQRSEDLLPARTHSLDERTHEAEVSASMAAAFVLRRMLDSGTFAEVSDGERAHVAHELPKREVQPRLALADQLRLRNHREGRSGAV